MKGSEWFETLPEAVEGKPTGSEIQEQQALIIDAVRTGLAVYHWIPVSISDELTIFVTSDALRIGNSEDSMRVAMSCRTQEIIARHLGAYMLTPKLVDEVWMRSDIKLNPHPQPISASKYAVLKHHQELEKDRAGRCGLVSGWKDWTMGKRIQSSPSKAQNYGWHVDTDQPSWRGIRLYNGATLGKVIQPPSLAHGLDHIDYSQMCRLVQIKALHRGQTVDLAELIQDPEFAGSLSTEGALAGLRHPGVQGDDERPSQPPSQPPESHSRPTPTKPGDKGPQVVAWQEFLLTYFEDRDIEALPRYGADGDHGGETEQWTQRWRSDSNELPIIQAANYTPANRTEVKWVMLHTMEATEKPTTAEAVARWFAGRSGTPPRASAHYCCDDDSIVLCVDETDVAWACGGANRFGVHYELAGYAKQSAKDWGDDFSQTMLRRAAKQAAVTAARWGIPVVKIGPTEMRAGHSGFCGHIDGTKAFDKSTHYDPGPDFPWDDFLVLVKDAM